MKKRVVKFEVELDADIVRKYREAVNAAYDFCKTPDAYSMAEALFYLIECEAATSISKQIVENGPHDSEINVSRLANCKKRISDRETRIAYERILQSIANSDKTSSKDIALIDQLREVFIEPQNIDFCLDSCNPKNGHDIECSQYPRTKIVSRYLENLGPCLTSCNPQSGHDPNYNRYKRKLAEDCEKKFPELMETVKELNPHTQPHENFYSKKLAEECEKTFPELMEITKRLNPQSREEIEKAYFCSLSTCNEFGHDRYCTKFSWTDPKAQQEISRIATKRSENQAKSREKTVKDSKKASNFYCRYCKLDMDDDEVRSCSAALAGCSEVCAPAAYAGIVKAKLKPERK